MRQRWPKSRVVAVDLSLSMLQQAPVRGGWRDRLGLQKPVDRVCADLRALPLADNSGDVLFSNLCLQWVEDLPAAFAGFRRVLKPDGLLLVSTFGPQTLIAGTADPHRPGGRFMQQLLAHEPQPEGIAYFISPNV